MGDKYSEWGLDLALLRAEAFFRVTCKANACNGYDYLTIYAKTTLPAVP